MAQGGGLNRLGGNPESIKQSSEQNDTALNDLGKLSKDEVAAAFTSKINNPARIGRGSDIERKGVTPIEVNSPTIAQNESINDGTNPSGIDSSTVSMESITDSSGNVNAESVIAAN